MSIVEPREKEPFDGLFIMCYGRAYLRAHRDENKFDIRPRVLVGYAWAFRSKHKNPFEENEMTLHEVRRLNRRAVRLFVIEHKRG